MGMFPFLRWILDAAQYCKIDNENLSDMPSSLYPHLEALGKYILSWMGCA